MENKLIVVGTILLLFQYGCALTTESINIQYAQQQGVSQIKGAKDVNVNVQVNDLRQDKSKVSSKKNGFGMEMAPIIAIEDVSVTFRRALEQELSARGFSLGANALVFISVDIIRFYNEHKLGFFAGDAVADLNMGVSIKSKKGELLYSQQIMAQGVEPNTQLMTGENACLALNRALGNGVRLLFEDQKFLVALLSTGSTQ